MAPGSTVRCCAPMAAWSETGFVAARRHALSPYSFKQPNSSRRNRIMSKQVIVITGASSGFGALTARALAKAGYTVYASMRETEGRNRPQVEAVEAFSKENGVEL